MNCKKCNTINSLQANYCKNCGQILEERNDDQTQSAKADLLLMIVIGILGLNTLFTFVHRQFYYNWFESPFKNVQLGLWILVDLSFILLPFVIKKRSLKIAGIIIITLITLFKISENVLGSFF